MTINERIKEIRKTLNMSQSDFAYKLGMSQRNISYLENVGSTVTEQNIKLICNVYNIDETWLRNGNPNTMDDKVGETENDFLKCAIELSASGNEPFKKLIIKYAKLNPVSKKIIDDFLQSFFDKKEE